MKMKLFCWVSVLCTVIGLMTSCSKDNTDDIPDNSIQIDTNVFYEIKSDTAVKVIDLINQVTLRKENFCGWFG